MTRGQITVNSAPEPMYLQNAQPMRIQNGPVNNALAFRDSNLQTEEYRQIEKAIIWALRAPTQMREIYGQPQGPYGLGMQQYSFDKITDMGEAVVDMTFVGHKDRTKKARTTVPVPIIQENFFIERRDLVASRKAGTPLDTQEAMSAAAMVNQKLEQILADGWSGDGTTYQLDGIIQGAGTTEATSKDFGTAGNAVSKTGLAMSALDALNVKPPFNMILPTTQYGQLVGSHWTSGVSEKEKVENLIGGIVIGSAELTAGTGFLVPTPGRGYFSWAVGVDVTTEYWTVGNKGTEGCVYMTAAPSIRNSTALCKLTNI